MSLDEFQAALLESHRKAMEALNASAVAKTQELSDELMAHVKDPLKIKREIYRAFTDPDDKPTEVA